MSNGQIITFYSYKGGTGRSMALANAATHLSNPPFNKKVLVIDWDLEAPGLHVYFHKLLKKRDTAVGTLDQGEAQPGVIEMFSDIETLVSEVETVKQRSGGNNESQYRPLTEDKTYSLLDSFDLKRYISTTSNPNLNFICAGIEDETYSRRVNQFNWEKLANKAPSVFTALGAYLMSSGEYDFILIDSRTGRTDSAGVCTKLMPEKLVVVFTPNRQSLSGVHDLVENAVSFRKRSNDLRQLVVFPLVSRIESSELQLAEKWRRGEPKEGIVGYQKAFEELLNSIYEIKSCSLERYFNEILVQQVPNQSYGENIVDLSVNENDAKALFGRYRIIVSTIAFLNAPWKFGEHIESIESSQSDIFGHFLDNPYPGLRPYESSEKETYVKIGQIEKELVEKITGSSNLIILHDFARTGKTSFSNCVLMPHLHSLGYTVDYIDSKLYEGLSDEQLVDKIKHVCIVDHAIESHVRSVISRLEKNDVSKTVFVLVMRSIEHSACSTMLEQCDIPNESILLSEYSVCDESNLRQIIEFPALMNGVLFEPRLIQELVNELIEIDSKDLPLSKLSVVQKLCNSLWDGKKSGWISYRQFVNQGGIGELIGNNARTFLATRSEEDKQVCANIFWQLRSSDFRNQKLKTKRFLVLDDINIPAENRYLLVELVKNGSIYSKRDGERITIHASHDRVFSEYITPRYEADNRLETIEEVRARREYYVSKDSDKRFLLEKEFLTKIRMTSRTQRDQYTVKENNFIDASNSNVYVRQKGAIRGLILSLVCLSLVFWFVDRELTSANLAKIQDKLVKVYSSHLLDSIKLNMMLDNHDHALRQTADIIAGIAHNDFAGMSDLEEEKKRDDIANVYYVASQVLAAKEQIPFNLAGQASVVRWSVGSSNGHTNDTLNEELIDNGPSRLYVLDNRNRISAFILDDGGEIKNPQSYNPVAVEDIVIEDSISLFFASNETVVVADNAGNLTILKFLVDELRFEKVIETSDVLNRTRAVSGLFMENETILLIGAEDGILRIIDMRYESAPELVSFDLPQFLSKHSSYTHEPGRNNSINELSALTGNRFIARLADGDSLTKFVQLKIDIGDGIASFVEDEVQELTEQSLSRPTVRVSPDKQSFVITQLVEEVEEPIVFRRSKASDKFIQILITKKPVSAENQRKYWLRERVNGAGFLNQNSDYFYTYTKNGNVNLWRIIASSGKNENKGSVEFVNGYKHIQQTVDSGVNGTAVSVTAVTVTPDDKFLISGDLDGYVKFALIEKFKETGELRLVEQNMGELSSKQVRHKPTINRIIASKDGRFATTPGLGSSSYDMSIWKFDQNSIQNSIYEEFSDEATESVEFLNNGRTLFKGKSVRMVNLGIYNTGGDSSSSNSVLAFTNRNRINRVICEEHMGLFQIPELDLEFIETVNPPVREGGDCPLGDDLRWGKTR